MISLQLESEVIKAAHIRKEQSKARKDRSRIERNTKQHKSKISDVDPQLTDESAPGKLTPGEERGTDTAGEEKQGRCLDQREKGGADGGVLADVGEVMEFLGGIINRSIKR